jgi:hypothetical protein
MQIVTLRLHDLSILFYSRYGAQRLPDDDSGRDDLKIALNHLACLPRPQKAISVWLEAWAPWLTLAERAEIVRPILDAPQRWKADALAWRLHLTMEQRTMLGITTIGAIDMPKAQRTKRRKQRDRDRLKAKRKQQGRTPRAEYEAKSLSRAKPWIAEGISRATWYRRRRAETTNPRETTVSAA